ncbi:MAG: iron-containing alcohol dehydrogenase [Pseudomonadota bacterium]
MFDNKTREQLSVIIPELPPIIGENSLRHDIDELAAMFLPVQSLAIVSDVNTNFAFGKQIYEALKGRFNCKNLILANGVEADENTINYIKGEILSCDALIAVGSGTINDLCKYTAYLTGKPYIVFPTAASMNGYLSVNASITIHGHKTTKKGKLPEAVLCDFSVISSAPLLLAKSGLGDSLARPTAQADWLLSHLLLGSSYDETPFKLLTDTEAELFDSAAGIAKNDPHMVRKLVELLLLSGIGMTISGGSYPASQGEHMIAHTYNMLGKANNKMKPLHGEEIAVTSLFMAKRQENLLNSLPKLCSGIFDKNYLAEFFADELITEFETEFGKKQKSILSLQIESINKTKWEEISDKIQEIILPAGKIENIIKKAELLAIPEQLGWYDKDYQVACDTARFTRDRFTFLDVE